MAFATIQSFSTLNSHLRHLIGYVEIENEQRWADIAKTDVCQRWWAHMKEHMKTNPDNSPVSDELREVFHID
jgi:L-rhamnose mutarotase